MKAYTKELELISLVNENYNHIQQLETLIEHYKLMKESDYSKEYPNEYNLTQEQIDKLYVIAKTTQNSHYDMKLYTQEIFKDNDNTVNNVLKSLGLNTLTSFKVMYYDKK